MATFIPNVTDVFPEPALFTPDFSFMDKMLSRRQALYDQGWAKVNAAYSFVNKDLTNPTNIKERDAFLKQARLNLNGLAATDLSQFQNVRAANNVFQPWVNNKRALGDAALTNHWKIEEETGMGYRLEDGGKYFNQANIDYIKKQRAAFATDSADSWKEYYSNKRSYIPYYDYHKEVQDLMKDFKPSTYEIDRVSGLYKYTDKNASWTQSEIRKYLDANLSDKAKQQMKIEGDVLYNNDPRQMGQVYMNSAKSEIAVYDAGIEYANKQLKSLSKPDDIKKTKDYITSLENAKKAVNLNIDAITKGDYTFVKKKGEALAYNIFYNNFLNKVSDGFSHRDITHKIDADDVALAIYKEDRDDIRQERKAVLDIELARLKGEIAPPGQLNTLTLKEGENVSLKTFQNKADEIQNTTNQLTELNKGIVATWMSTLPEYRGKEVSTKDVTQKEVERFLKEGNNGKPIPKTHSWYANQAQIRENELAKDVVLNRITDIQNKIKSSYSDTDKAAIDKFNAQIDNVTAGNLGAKKGVVTLDDGTQIKTRDLYEGLANGTIDVSKNWFSDGYTVKMNGKEYQTVNELIGEGDESSMRTVNAELIKAIENINAIRDSNKISKKYENDVKEYFETNGKELTYTANLQTFSKGSYEAKTLEAQLRNLFPEGQFDVQHAGIGVDARNSGSAFFYIDPKGDNKSSTTDVVAYLNQRGYPKVEAITPANSTGTTLYKIDNFKSPVITQYNQFNNLEKLVLNDLSQEKPTGTGGRYETRQYTSNSDRYLQIKKEHNLYYLLVQGLNGGNTMDQYPQAFADPTSAILLGQYLTAPSAQGVPEAQLQWYINNNVRK